MGENNNQDIVNSQPKPAKKGHGCLRRLIIFSALVFVVWWANNYLLFTTEVEITSSKVKNEIKIAVISDLHATENIFAISNNAIIKKINMIKPDVVCVLGDMHTTGAPEEEKNISMNLMTGIIDEGYKLFFVLGEHDDRTNAYVSKMEANGIDVLDQESEKIKIKDTEITFHGISNAWFSEYFDLRNELDINKNTYNVLLAHIPMFEQYEKFGADLTLCADTHGGVIQVPFLGPAYYDSQILPELFNDEKEVYDKGLFPMGKGYLFITSGIGNYPIPARFNNFPEIGEITIKPEK